MNILENIYYITAIAVSFGVFRGVFNLFKISNKHEVLLINNYQKKILKYFYIIKYFIFGFFMYCYFYFCYCSIYDIICILLYWFMIFCLINFLDEILLYVFKEKTLLLYKQFIQNFKDEKKIFFVIVSIFLTLIVCLIESKVNIIYYTIAQIVCLSIFYFCISKHYTQICKKYLNFGDKLFVVYLSPLLIKLLCVLTYTSENNNTSLLISEDGVVSILSDIVHSDNFNYIFVAIFILAWLFSKNFTESFLRCSVYIMYKNRIWWISYITNDNYAICKYGKFSIMVNVDIIKNNYICVRDGWTFIFYEKEKFKEINIENS